jgi:subtilase family serine protease
VFGGTSVAAPIVASVYALAGNASTVSYGSYPYSHTSSLFDVLSGSNGSCGGSYLCTARTGFDGPTGLGSPNGTAGF